MKSHHGALCACATLLALAAAVSPTVRLNDGTLMPRIAAGTWQYTPDQAEAAVAAALQAGYRHIDTAFNYHDQPGIAKALQAAKISRGELYLTTKVPGCGLSGIGFESCAEDSVAAHKQNLAQLGVAYTDLLLVHFPPKGGCGSVNCAAMRKQWTALSDEVLRANLTRTLGVSNFCIACLKCLSQLAGAVTPAVNQIQYHVGMGADPGGLLSYSASQGIAVEAYSPLGTNTTELIHGNLTTEIGKAHNKSSAEVALRWVLEHVPSVTTKSSSPEHLAQDLQVLHWGLSQQELSKLDAATSPPGTPSFMCTDPPVSQKSDSWWPHHWWVVAVSAAGAVVVLICAYFWCCRKSRWTEEHERRLTQAEELERGLSQPLKDDK